MICLTCIDAVERHAGEWDWRWERAYCGPMSFGSWALHRLIHSQHLLGFDLLRFLWMRVGVIDALHEGGTMFWRWDFWNSIMRRQARA